MTEQQRPEYRGMDSSEPAAPAPMTTEQPLAYNPISGWAVAGCIVGGLFAVLVAVCTVLALLQGAPLFFPLWILVIALAGIVLSLIGQWHVQSSDGTRVGAGLARIGLWLSLVSGLSYLSYSFVTGLALANQANDFMMEKSDDDSGFFPRLREGGENTAQFNAAFLLSRSPTARGSARPTDDKAMHDKYDVPRDSVPGEMSQFRDHPMVRIFFKSSAKSVEVTSLSAQDWVYEQKMYKVVRNYRLTTKEANADFRVSILSTQSDRASQGRKWFVNLRDTTLVNTTPTEFGKGLRFLRGHAAATLDQWSKKPGASPLHLVENVDGTAWDIIVPEGDSPKERRSMVYERLTGDAPLLGMMLTGRYDDLGQWEEVGGKIRVYINFRLPVARTPNGPTAFTMVGYAGLEPAQAINPETFTEGSPPPTWNLARIAFTSIIPQGSPSKQ
ncbi:MAG TPA: hypothetical protein VFE62_13450 [Gemmataceae bacterium]|nr:hypothetical protein [Gemmataceae bacterium]